MGNFFFIQKFFYLGIGIFFAEIRVLHYIILGFTEPQMINRKSRAESAAGIPRRRLYKYILKF